MFFVNSDLKKQTTQKNLSQVVQDDNVKVAYGVLSLSNYIDMVKHVGNSEKIRIPKVQRGLVWGRAGKEDFINNCIIGREDGLLEPMPNIFLFCDKETKEIHLFDGLQRTSAILQKYKDSSSIDNDVMIPAALFKGTREEAESLFRNINDKGVKLNDFEKLASFGGKYPVNLNKTNDTFRKEFKDFVDKTTRQYIEIGLSISDKEESTLFEILVYAIYKFSNTKNAIDIFPSNQDGERNLYDEWGFQLAYSATTKSTTKKYSKKDMMGEKGQLLINFGEVIKYSQETQSFDIDLLNEFIDKINIAITKTEIILRDIYKRNIVSNNNENLCKAALDSNALVGSLVMFCYYNPSSINEDGLRYWYLTQLVSGRASSNTNSVVDELLKSSGKSTLDFKKELNDKVTSKINDNESFKGHKAWLWVLYWLQYETIKKYSLTTIFEIDHIIPKSLIKKVYPKSEIANRIGNLAITTKEWNRKKLDSNLIDFYEQEENGISSVKNYYSIDNKFDDKKVLEKWLNSLGDAYDDFASGEKESDKSFISFADKRKRWMISSLEEK